MERVCQRLSRPESDGTGSPAMCEHPGQRLLTPRIELWVPVKHSGMRSGCCGAVALMFVLTGRVVVVHNRPVIISLSACHQIGRF